MTLREQFEQETGWTELELYYSHYSEWLELQLATAEEEKKQKAWETWKWLTRRFLCEEHLYTEEYQLKQFEKWWEENK